MKIKVSEATTDQLDWLVGIANGWLTYPTDSVEQGLWFHTDPKIAPLDYEHDRIRVQSYRPTTDWAQAGPIIEREIHTLMERNGVWEAECFHPKFPNKGRFCYVSTNGATPLIASMRAFVSSRLGNEVEIPEELK